MALIWKQLQEVPSEPSGSTAAIGNFDGVHRGHARVIETTKYISKDLGTRSIAITFHPHPSRIIKPDRHIQSINSLAENASRLSNLGIEGVLALSFTREFASLSPEEFFNLIQPSPLSLRAIVIGYDFRFGRDKSGTTELLAALGKPMGVSTHIVPPLKVGGKPVSSRRIRDLLHEGKIQEANSLLGYSYTITGLVTRGRGRGTKIGFPTANLVPEIPPLVPSGVYAVRAALRQAGNAGVMSLGPRPTFQDFESAVEVHLLDLPPESAPRPGDSMRVEIIGRIRENRPFPDPESLVSQISRDIAAARTLLR